MSRLPGCLFVIDPRRSTSRCTRRCGSAFPSSRWWTRTATRGHRLRDPGERQTRSAPSGCSAARSGTRRSRGGPVPAHGGGQEAQAAEGEGGRGSRLPPASGAASAAAVGHGTRRARGARPSFRARADRRSRWSASRSGGGDGEVAAGLRGKAGGVSEMGEITSAMVKELREKTARDDGLQEGAAGSRWRPGEGSRLAAEEGLATAQKKGWPLRDRGRRGSYIPHGRKVRRAGRGELRDRLHRAEREVPGAGEEPGHADRLEQPRGGCAARTFRKTSSTGRRASTARSSSSRASPRR